MFFSVSFLLSDSNLCSPGTGLGVCACLHLIWGMSSCPEPVVGSMALDRSPIPKNPGGLPSSGLGIMLSPCPPRTIPGGRGLHRAVMALPPWQIVTEHLQWRFGGERIWVYLSSLSLLLSIFTKISVSSPSFNSVTNSGLISSYQKVIFGFRPCITKLRECIYCRMLQEEVGQKVGICGHMLHVASQEVKDRSSSDGPFQGALMDVWLCVRIPKLAL